MTKPQYVCQKITGRQERLVSFIVISQLSYSIYLKVLAMTFKLYALNGPVPSWEYAGMASDGKFVF